MKKVLLSTLLFITLTVFGEGLPSAVKKGIAAYGTEEQVTGFEKIEDEDEGPYYEVYMETETESIYLIIDENGKVTGVEKSELETEEDFSAEDDQE